MAARKPPSLLNAVTSALRAAKIEKADAGTTALVKRYAWIIEEAAEVAAAASMIEADDADTEALIQALTRRVEALDVLATIGPKLLAGLSELGMTPKARAAVVSKVRGGGPGDNSGVGDRRATLTNLGARAAQRLGPAG